MEDPPGNPETSPFENEFDPFADDHGPDDYPRYRVRRALTKAVALLLIIGMLLAFPLGYLLDAELRNQHLEAVLALVELTVAAVLVAVVRSGRVR